MPSGRWGNYGAAMDTGREIDGEFSSSSSGSDNSINGPARTVRALSIFPILRGANAFDQPIRPHAHQLSVAENFSKLFTWPQSPHGEISVDDERRKGDSCAVWRSTGM